MRVNLIHSKLVFLKKYIKKINKLKKKKTAREQCKVNCTVHVNSAIH